MDDHATAQSNLKGVLLLALAFFLFSSSDTISKYLTAELHPIQIVWTRQAALMLGALVILAVKGPSLLRTGSPWLQVTRGALAVGSAVCFMLAIRHVPLADAIAVTFVVPFMVTVLGVVLLGETVGVRRWSAIIVGFIGALIIIRPGLGVFHPAIFFVLLAALFFAFRQVMSRMLAATDRTLTTVVYTALVSAAILSIPVPFFWQTPDSAKTIGLLAAMAGLAAVGEILIIRAFELAQASVAAPVHYSLIIWATFYGWLIFDQLPDFWTWVGTGIIFATGIYLIYRERAVKTQKPAR